MRNINKTVAIIALLSAGLVGSRAVEGVGIAPVVVQTTVNEMAKHERAPGEPSGITPEVSSAPVRTVVPAAAVLSWDDLVRRDRENDGQDSTQPSAIPQMPYPGPRAIQASRPQAHGNSRPAEAPQLAMLPTCGGLGPPIFDTGFQGLPDNNTRIPPDTMGAVGPNHVMTTLNTQYRIQTRTGAVVSTVSMSGFWSPLGGSPFDPKLIYDAASGRWLAASIVNSFSPASAVYLAVSATSDPTGIWAFYSMDADGADVTWADFPCFGVNANWIAITANMFPNAGGTFQGSKMWVIDKGTALAGGPLTITTS